VYLDKPGGLIVDYIGIASDFKKALSFYAASGGKGKPTETQEDAINLMLSKLEIIEQMLEKLPYGDYFSAEMNEKLSIILQTEEYILSIDNGKDRFVNEVTTLSQAFSLSVPLDEAMAIKEKVSFFQAVKARLQKKPRSQNKSYASRGQIMTNLKIFLTSFLLAIFSVSISFATDNPTSIFESRVHEGHLCARGSAWINTKNLVLEVSSKDIGVSASYDTKIYENHDMKIILKDSSLTKGDSPGEAILVGGRALLIKNIEIEENYAIDVLDGAALFQQLAFTILELSSENGPVNTSLPFHKEISEPKYPVKATTQSASAYFHPPWNSVVDLKQKDDGVISFNINFNFVLEGGKETSMQMEGYLSNFSETNNNQNIPDNFNISEWNQYNIGPYTKKMGTGSIYDFGTTFIESRYATLEELRKYIKEKYK